MLYPRLLHDSVKIKGPTRNCNLRKRVKSTTTTTQGKEKGNKMIIN